MEIEDSGRRVLEVLVPHLTEVVPGKPETYLGYKYVHEALGLTYLGPTWGESLKKQGLAALADWTYENDLPGITGIIINTDSYEPGKGYFKLFGKDEGDYPWWAEEIRKSKTFNWSPYIQVKFDLKPVDLTSPDREDITVSRIIRDSKLSARVKALNDWECQICGLTLDMPEGKKYAEAHHIQPLGKPHSGPDVIENMICVCPNHHAMLDYGAVKLSGESIVSKHGHAISEQFIEYHNKNVYQP
jgi:hypothetical protein